MGLLPLVTTAPPAGAQEPTLFNSVTRQFCSTYAQHLVLTNGKGTRRAKPKKHSWALSKGATTMAWTSQNLHVNQRTWVLSHCPCSLLVMAGPSTARSLFPSLEIQSGTKPWSQALLCLREVQRVRGAKAVRVSGREVLTQGTVLTEFHKVSLLLWSLPSGLPPSPPRAGWGRSPAKSSHYSFALTAAWKTRSPWDLAKSQGWNVKFSNSGICSTTLSQHTDLSKGITGYQPLSQGALYTRLALVLAGGVAQTGATTAQLTRDEGQCSHCSRRALPNDRINPTAANSAPGGA